MKSLLLLLALLAMIGQAKASKITALTMHEVLVEKALKEASEDTRKEYKECIEGEEKNIRNCENDILGDLYN